MTEVSEISTPPIPKVTPETNRISGYHVAGETKRTFGIGNPFSETGDAGTTSLCHDSDFVISHIICIFSRFC
jgi:hypothetical protein